MSRNILEWQLGDFCGIWTKVFSLMLNHLRWKFVFGNQLSGLLVPLKLRWVAQKAFSNGCINVIHSSPLLTKHEPLDHIHRSFIHSVIERTFSTERVSSIFSIKLVNWTRISYFHSYFNYQRFYILVTACSLHRHVQASQAIRVVTDSIFFNFLML